MDKPVVKALCRHALRWAGLCFLLISTLPWLGLSGCFFGLPGSLNRLPSLGVIGLTDRSFFYEIVSIPVHVIGMLPGMDGYVFFREGIVTPFAIFVFYFILGSLSVWAGGLPRFSLRRLLWSVALIGIALGYCLAVDRANYNARRTDVRKAVFDGRIPLYEHLREYFTEIELKELDSSDGGKP